MNLEFFTLINGLAHRNVYFDSVMVMISKYIPYVFMVLVVALFIQGVIKKSSSLRKDAVNTVMITLINLSLGYMIGLFYYVDRPFVNHKVNLLFPHVADASFPSDHAIGTMSIALGLGKHNKIAGIGLTCLSILVGFSRVYVGHHYPADVIGAYLMVTIITFIYNSKLRGKTDKIYDKIEQIIIGKIACWKVDNDNARY